MTLFEEIQQVLERTYTATGLRLEQFLIGRDRCAALSALAGPSARELNDHGRTFLRLFHGNLLLAIYYSAPVVEQLEQEHPRQTVNDRNIRPLIVFIEELAHAVHAALRFLEGHRDIGHEHFCRDLELQGKVDTYLVLQWLLASLRGSRRLPPTDRQWLRHHLFETERFDYDDPNLAERYRETNRLGADYTAHLDSLAPRERVAEIRRFRPLPYREKRNLILSL